MAVMGGWRSLSGEMVNSLGQVKCAFDRLRNSKTVAVAAMSEQAHAC